MTEQELEKIADDAIIIVDGFAFNTDERGFYKILNLYDTDEACVLECMHAHASDEELTEGGSAKIFIQANGNTVVADYGKVSDKERIKEWNLLIVKPYSYS